ncbi:hypothetical protein ANN_03223 [Periplaneta americana]|uniref:Uncharacterized protein n=1 Tax=Periplaneta americana TaxID=6978 RepID=A0ABQ8TYE9_PERAM|nr:hypothetical protein ANN_03223 [Periplaneta americana]
MRGGCNATVTLSEGGSSVVKEPSEHKNHSADWGTIKTKECVENMQARAGTSREPLSVVIQTELERTKEKKELVESLAEKELPTEGYTARNGEREKSSGQKKDQMIDDIKIFGSYAETKNHDYAPPFPTTLDDLCVCFTAAIAEIDRDLLQRVWQEIDYRLDVCPVTQGVYIEHL